MESDPIPPVDTIYSEIVLVSRLEVESLVKYLRNRMLSYVKIRNDSNV